VTEGLGFPRQKTGFNAVRIHEEKIEHLNVARHLIFVAVQLTSPVEKLDWDFDTDKQAWVWRPNPKNARIRETQAALDMLFSSKPPKKPDIIIFPEYSVPKEAHKKIDFQQLADQNSTIIVAGSYFEDLDTSPLFRKNVCHIYLPKSDAITIGKIHAAPDEKGVLPATELPNIARFVWEPPGQDPVSISVFLCRDYLTPFSENICDIHECLDAGVARRVSLLDWDREGINIIVMNNSKSQLFEGAAAFDVREVHGKRKAVLFVNCAQDNSDLGTALLVPSLSRERADIVASLPSRNAGVLFAEVRLWEVVVQRRDPDTKKSFPVKHVGIFSIDFSKAAAAIFPLKMEKPAPLSRGIWHPAFLEELRKIIVLDFYVAESTLVTVAEAFAKDQIRHVKAGFVRGVQDVMVRRYVPRYLQKNGRVPLSLPFSYLSDDDLRKVFTLNQNFSDLQVIIYTEKLLKYRGQKIQGGGQLEKSTRIYKERCRCCRFERSH